MPEFTVLVRAADFSTQGAASDYTLLTATPRFNAVGSWQLAYPADSASAALLFAGRGVQIFRRDATGGPPILSGPLTNIAESLDSSRKVPQLVFSGACDNIWLAARAALPDPTVSGNVYSHAYDVRSGPAETVIRGYVNANAGPGALTARQVAGLTLAADLARGASVSFSARFDSLLTVLQNIALGAGLGFQVQQIGRGLVFSIYQPRNLQNLIRFSVKTGSLGAYSYSLSGPSATAAYVGDGTPGTGRSFSQFINSTAEADWGMRYEAFVDSSNTTDATQVAQAGAQALDQGSPQAQVTFSPIDTPQRRFGVDYGLGDSVTVQVSRSSVIDVVREVNITDDATNGVKVLPTVGGSQASAPSSNSALYSLYRLIGLAVGYIQRRF